MSQCESPVEELLLQALRGVMHRVSLLGFTLHVQHEVPPYRLDLAFVHPAGGLLAVEVDGHAFHERTKEQALRDKRRDRALTLQGWRVIHFTGAEVHASAIQCANETLMHLEQLCCREPSAAMLDRLAKRILKISKDTEEKVEERRRSARIQLAQDWGWSPLDHYGQMFVWPKTGTIATYEEVKLFRGYNVQVSFGSMTIDEALLRIRARLAQESGAA